MTRDDALATYRPIRAAIQRVLRAAVPVCGRPDMTRAAKQLGLWADGRIMLDEEGDGGGATEMLADVALFEPNQRGRRAFDGFLEGKRAQRLDPADLDLARRMAGAFFSIFRVAGRHEAAGLWLEDLLEGDRRLWLMDEALEAPAPKGAVFGARLFDAGPFHAGFGIIVATDEETIGLCVETKARSGRLPFRHSLAATLYGDSLRAEGLVGPADQELLEALLDLLPPDLAAPPDDDDDPSGGGPENATRRSSWRRMR